MLRDSESLVDQYHSLGIRLENQSQIYKSLEKAVETFHIEEENTRTWVRNVKHGLETPDKDEDIPTEEKFPKIQVYKRSCSISEVRHLLKSRVEHVDKFVLCYQVVLDLHGEGDSRMAALKMDGESLCAREELEESVRQEIIRTLRNLDDEWRRVLDSARQLKAQAELQRTLFKELEALQDDVTNTRSWVDEQMRKLDFLDKDTSVQERHKQLQVGSKSEIIG